MACAASCKGETETFAAEAASGLCSSVCDWVGDSINARMGTAFAGSRIGAGETTTEDGMACAAGCESEKGTVAAEAMSGLG
jgi:hypothetical protein